MTKARRVHVGVDNTYSGRSVPIGMGRESHASVAVTDFDRSFAIVLIAAVALATGIVARAVVNITNGWVGFATLVLRGISRRHGGRHLFGRALRRTRPASDRGRRGRLALAVGGVWVFVVLGLGQLVFGYIVALQTAHRAGQRAAGASR